jgi:hypothetical protein
LEPLNANGVYNHQFNGIGKVNGEHRSLILVYCNIKRSINILGVPDLIVNSKWNSQLEQSLVLLKQETYKACN